MDGFVCIRFERPQVVDERKVQSIVRGCVVVDTCERFEVYGYFPQERSELSRIRARFGAKRGRELHGRDAVRHLLRIAAGLESRVVGEPHVLGQIRRAFRDAQLRENVGHMLAALFRTALRTGRRVRGETRLNAKSESVVTLALQRLESDLGSLSGKRIGIVGTGDLARETVAALTKQGATSLAVFSRSSQRAKQIRTMQGSPVYGLDDWARTAPGLDAVIACCRTANPILRATHFAESFGRLTCVIDLGYPQNIDESVGAIARISLTRLDDLTRSAPTVELAFANRVVIEELSRLDQWTQNRKAARLIERLVRDADLPPSRSTQALHAKIMRAKAQVAA